MRSEFALLRDRDLAVLASSRFVSVLGSGIGPIALAFGVLALPGATATSLGIVMAARAVPQAVFMLLGGVLADRFPRRQMMITAELLAGAAQFAVAWVFLAGDASIALLALLSALQGLAVALFFPAFTGIVPQVVPAESLQPANALLRLATNFGTILGAALGGVMVAVIGAGWAIAADGATFILGAALLALLRLRVASGAREEAESALHGLKVGWREFTSRRWVVTVVVLFSLANMGFSAVLGVLGPLRAVQSYGGAAPWGLVVTSFGAGAFAGALVALRLRPRRPLALGMGIAALMALPVAAAAVPTALWVVIATGFVAGVVADVFSVQWDSSLQWHVPAEALSRVASYDWLGSVVLVPIGLAVAGPLADSVGVSSALWIAAGLGALPVLALLDPQVRRLPVGGETS